MSADDLHFDISITVAWMWQVCTMPMESALGTYGDCPSMAEETEAHRLSRAADEAE